MEVCATMSVFISKQRPCSHGTGHSIVFRIGNLELVEEKSLDIQSHLLRMYLDSKKKHLKQLLDVMCHVFYLLP